MSRRQGGRTQTARPPREPQRRAAENGQMWSREIHGVEAFCINPSTIMRSRL